MPVFQTFHSRADGNGWLDIRLIHFLCLERALHHNGLTQVRPPLIADPATTTVTDPVEPETVLSVYFPMFVIEPTIHFFFYSLLEIEVLDAPAVGSGRCNERRGFTLLT